MITHARAMQMITLALDGLCLNDALELTEEVGGLIGGVKANHLWNDIGPELPAQLKRRGAKRVFIDLKFKDIPETVRKNVRALVKAGADLCTVMADGEVEMMIAALEAAEGKLEVIAVTALTSLDEDQTHLTYGNPRKAETLYLARLARLAGVPSVVCSPKEVGLLSKRPELVGMNFYTPGIRSEGKDVDDQKAVGTPGVAVKNGSHMLIMGRQIIEASYRRNAIQDVAHEIVEALTTAKVQPA